MRLFSKGNQIVQAIQVSYDISNPKTLKRELEGLALAAKTTDCTNLLLLTDHDSGTKTIAGQQVTVQPVYEWCSQLGL